MEAQNHRYPTFSIAKVERQKVTEEELSLERRAKPRIEEPFPTTVSGVDRSGEAFQVDCVLENISSTGVYLKLPRQMEEGSEVRMLVMLSAASSPGAGAAIKGVALRSEPQADESWGLAVAIRECALV